MQLTHSFSVPATIDVAWATFMDLREVGECFPGATVTDASGDSFTGQVKVKLGPIAMVYTGTGTFTERDDDSHHAVIKAEGKDKRGNGTAGATATIQLSPDGVEATQVDVTTDLLITGKPAQFGRGVMQDVSDKLLAQFVSCIEGKLSSGSAPAGASTSSASGSAGSAMSQASSSGADMESGATDQIAARGASSGTAASAEPLGTAAMFGATAGADSWESRSGHGSDSGSGKDPVAPGARGGTAGSAASPASRTAGAGGPSTGDRAPARHSAASSGADDDALDLGATVLPVLLKSHGREVAIGAVAFVVGWKLGRFLPG